MEITFRRDEDGDLEILQDDKKVGWILIYKELPKPGHRPSITPPRWYHVHEIIEKELEITRIVGKFERLEDAQNWTIEKFAGERR